jgi:hypothetical protein
MDVFSKEYVFSCPLAFACVHRLGGQIGGQKGVKAMMASHAGSSPPALEFIAFTITSA